MTKCLRSNPVTVRLVDVESELRRAPAVAIGALAVTSGVSAADSAGRPTVAPEPSRYGRVLFDGRGRGLYAFTRDRRGRKSTCYGACARAWPPYLVRSQLRAGRGARAALLGVVRRRDGSRQLTYAGRPLYYYVGDGVREVKCQNVYEFGGLWLVVRGIGRLVRS